MKTISSLLNTDLLVLALMSAIFEVVSRLYSFCEFSGKQKEI